MSAPCKYGDPACPCQDGDTCHYEGKDAWPKPVPLDRQIAAVRREVGMRKRVYPSFIQKGKMSAEEADRQIEAMEAVQRTLEGLKAQRVPELF